MGIFHKIMFRKLLCEAHQRFKNFNVDEALRKSVDQKTLADAGASEGR